jgi:hypothetical protein
VTPVLERASHLMSLKWSRDGVQPSARREGVGCKEGRLGAREGSGNPERKK